MNIAFDGVALLGRMSKNRGIGNYTLDQIRTILRNDRNNRYFFFNAMEKTDIFEQEIQAGLLQEDDFFCMKNGYFLSSPGMPEVYESLVKKYLETNKIDLFYITSPFDGSLPIYKKEWFQNTRVVATVYDVIPYVMRKHYFPREEDMKWYMERVDMLRWADRLLAISQSAKDDLVQYLNFEEDRIDVIWGAAGEKFKKIEISSEEQQLLLQKFHIDSPYIMCTGGDDERKNIAGLIEAFGKLPDALKRQHQLVIVCKLQQASVDRYTKLAKQCGIKDRVVLTNFVTDEELVQFYNLAELVAFPSVYEGFGLPVVEAWACGTPVLTSNNSSLVQIAGDAAILVDPYSVDDIERGLETALTDCDLHELAQKGQKRVQLFQWDRVAQLTVDSFAKIEPKETAPQLRRHIAMFTPLPPIQSGISDYSVDILCALSEYFDIDVYVNSGYQPNCKLPETIRIYPHSQYSRRQEQYYDTVYQMGNSEYHVYMWPYIKQYGGTLVLHDYNMHGIAQAVAIYIQKNNFSLYKEMMLEDLAPEKVQMYLNNLERGHRINSKEIELNGFVTNYANKIIVHSREAKEKLLIRNIGRNVRWIRHYARLESLPDVGTAKKEVGIPEDTLLYAAFGHVHETKRVIPILRAFAKVAPRQEKARLVFVGKLDSNLEPLFYQEVQRLGLEDKVHVTGYTDLKEFKRYMDATDICLNLRWPYNGETSGSLMRILAKGKCVIVNNIGSFAEIPDDACVKIPSVESMSAKAEVDAIFEAMSKLAEDAKLREDVQHSARQFAEEYLDIKKIAEQYAAFILESFEPVVTEDLVGRLKKEAAEKRCSEAELHSLAHTLGYIKL